MQRHFPTRILLVYAPFHDLALKLREIGFEQSPISSSSLDGTMFPSFSGFCPRPKNIPGRSAVKLSNPRSKPGGAYPPVRGRAFHEEEAVSILMTRLSMRMPN